MTPALVAGLNDSQKRNTAARAKNLPGLMGIGPANPQAGGLSVSPLGPQPAPGPPPDPTGLIKSLMGDVNAPIAAPPVAQGAGLPTNTQTALPEREPMTVGVGKEKLTSNNPTALHNFIQERLETNMPNPNEVEILKAQQAKDAAQSESQWLQANPEPQRATLNEGPAPTLQQTPTPQQGQAQLNPLAVALGMATGFGGAYGNPAQAVADQATAAIHQTHANFETQLQQADFAATQAAEQYHAQMEARNEKLKIDTLNNQTLDLNNQAGWKQRYGIHQADVTATGADTLGQGATRNGQLQNNMSILENQDKNVTTTEANRLKNAETISSIHRNDAGVNASNAATNASVQATGEKNAFFPLDYQKKLDDIRAGRISLKKAAIDLGTSVVQLQGDMAKLPYVGPQAAADLAGKNLENTETKGKIDTGNIERQLKQIELANKQKDPNSLDVNELRTALEVGGQPLATATKDLADRQKMYQDSDDAVQAFSTKFNGDIPQKARAQFVTLGAIREKNIQDLLAAKRAFKLAQQNDQGYRNRLLQHSDSPALQGLAAPAAGSGVLAPGVTLR